MGSARRRQMARRLNRDAIRARVVTLSLNEREPRESKIGLTMRQAGLGTQRWLDEDYEKEQEKIHGGA